jgi:DNA-binding protein HU-beta
MSNPNKINKEQLLEKISQRANVSKKEVEDVIDAFEAVVIDAMKAGKEAVLTGFGSFLSRTRESRMGVNPQKPSERIKIPTVIVPKFKAGKTLKDALKGQDENESKESAPEVEAEPKPQDPTEH